MSTTAANPGGRSDRRSLMWAGHYSLHMALFFLLPAMLAYVLAGSPSGRSGVLSWALSACWFLWFGTLLLDVAYHETRLCERCIAATPLDPRAAVQRWQPVLRMRHSKAARAAVVAVFAISAVASNFGSFRNYAAWPDRIVTAVNVVALAALNLVQFRHRRLYPWCPWCNWGDGGSAEAVPDIPVLPERVH